MTREQYIEGLENLRKEIEEIGSQFAFVFLNDAQDMEKERRKKTAKLIADLRDRLYEDAAVSAKILADNKAAGIGEQDDLFDGAEAPAAASASPLALPAPELPAPGTPPADEDGKKGKKGKRGKKGGDK